MFALDAFLWLSDADRVEVCMPAVAVLPVAGELAGLLVACVLDREQPEAPGAELGPGLGLLVASNPTKVKPDVLLGANGLGLEAGLLPGPDAPKPLKGLVLGRALPDLVGDPVLPRLVGLLLPGAPEAWGLV